MTRVSRGRVFRGMSVVEEALRLERFPMSVQDVNYAVGDIELELGEGRFVPVRDLLDDTSDHRFKSVEEVVHALREGKKAA